MTRRLVNTSAVSCLPLTRLSDARVGGTRLDDTGVTHNPAGTAPAEGTIVTIAGAA